ncbi:MAG: LysR family transcriptional regulator [Acidobacteriia bacterium]|nr:LysR family transcriptional regulator [Terriglobia bacterium]
MELRHVRYFLAVAEYLNFSKAAQQLHIAQPPLSRQIRQLEEDLGVALFVRNKRRVELTKAGRVFLDEARKLVVQAGHATEAARHAQKGEFGVVKIGIASGLGGVVGKTVGEHCKRFPTVNIECKDIFSTAQNEALHKCEIDVGFMRPPVDQVNLGCELLYEEEFVVVLPKSHRLAKRKFLRLKDVADEPLIVFDRNFSCGLYDKILGLYSRQGLTPHFTVTHVEAHEEAGAIMVASGRAIFIGAGAIVTRSVHGMELASVPLNEAEAKIDVYMAWRKDEESNAVLSFLDSVRRVCRRSTDKAIA